MKGIHIIEHWFGERLYPTAGDTGGIAPFLIAVYFTAIVMSERCAHWSRGGFFETWALIMFISSSFFSFYEIEGDTIELRGGCVCTSP